MNECDLDQHQRKVCSQNRFVECETDISLHCVVLLLVCRLQSCWCVTAPGWQSLVCIKDNMKQLNETIARLSFVLYQ